MTITRRALQAGFLVLTLVGVFVVAGNAERWCPFGGVEALYTYVQHGDLVCSLGITNFYILAAILLMTLLLRRAFCGYVCPIGAVSEWLRAGGKRLGLRRSWQPSRGVDRVLSLGKYLVLAVILYFTWRGGELYFRGYDPCYALISRHGEDITFWAYAISGAIVLASLVISIPFCRWLCPLAAVLNPFSRFGMTRIRRNESTCTDCGACARACPMNIPVDTMKEVTAARCTSCLNCIEKCAFTDRGALVWSAPLRSSVRRPALLMTTGVVGLIALAVVASAAFPLPSFVSTVRTVDQPPAKTAMAVFKVDGLECRGTATLLEYFLKRDDELAVPGYLKMEAWPGPGAAKLHVIYDPEQTDEEMISMAITQPYFDTEGGFWRTPPFRIEGYDPLGLGLDDGE